MREYRNIFRKIREERKIRDEQGEKSLLTLFLADSNKYSTDSRKAKSEISSSTTRSPVRSSLPLRRASFSPKTPTASALPPCEALVQGAGSIKQTSQPQPHLGVSMSERIQKFSKKEEQEDIKLVQGARERGLERKSDVRVSFWNQTVPTSDTGRY